MTENFIKILNFDNDSNTVYFQNTGIERLGVTVILSWNNLTLYHTIMNLANDHYVTYYVGSNNTNVGQINHLEIKFLHDNHEEIHTIKITENQISIYENKKFHTDERDTCFYTFNEVMLNRIYDDKLIKIYENDVVVDIGANYGFFSLYAQEFNPSKVFSLEPSKKIFNFLQKNISDCELKQVGVSGKSERLLFSDNNGSSAASRLSDNGEYEVDIIGINDLLNYLNVEKIDFLKIDCEGSEKEIFEEITLETISRIKKIVVEFHSQEIKNLILDKLNNYDFVVEKVTTELIFAYQKDYFSSKKKIALISTYCDTQEKKDIFLNLVKKVKSFGVDVIAISPLPLDKEHIEACDYLYFTKENPILKWPQRLFTFWREWILPDGRITTMQRGVGDYSWAALYHVKKLTQIAMDYDYDIFYHMIYDLDVDEVVEKAIKNFEGNIVYPRRDPHNPESIWETTLHFMSFDKDLMKKIEKEITLEQYLSTNGVAEGEVFKWKKKFNIAGSEHPVKDLIYYWKDYDFFDYSPTKDFKIFFSKNHLMEIWIGQDPSHLTQLPKNLRVLFYDFSEPIELTIFIDGSEYKVNPEPYQFIELPHSAFSIKELSIKYKDEIYDLSERFEDIMFNQIYYNHRP